MNTIFDPALVSLSYFDRSAFEHSVKWLEDDYIAHMICAFESSYEEKEKWYKSLAFKEDYKCWVVNYEDIPIGVCGIKNIKPDSQVVKGEYFGYIGEQKFRGKGLGRVLVQLALSQAKKLGLGLVYLKVLKENTPALSLYMKTGFSLTKEDSEFIFMEQQIR